MAGARAMALTAWLLRRPRRLLAIIAALLIVDGMLVAWVSDDLISRFAEQRHSEQAAPVPAVALVLGTSPRLRDGRPNIFFQQRMRAAATLYASGSVSGLLLSGDNGHRDYDEPTAMYEALLELGVPAAAMTRDYAGFSTFDSVVRARRVFALDAVQVVSQGFHVERALFLAEATGLRAHGIDAGQVRGRGGLRVRSREVLARVRVMGDLALWGRQPRFLGPLETVQLVER